MASRMARMGANVTQGSGLTHPRPAAARFSIPPVWALLREADRTTRRVAADVRHWGRRGGWVSPRSWLTCGLVASTRRQRPTSCFARSTLDAVDAAEKAQ